MSTTITAKCVDQNLKIVSAPDIASGGVNEDHFVVEFCPLWEGYDKTAVFYRTKDDVYHAPLDEEGKCTIPWEVMQTPGYLYLGVFGCKDDITRTSLVARYAVKPGAITEETRPSEPTPNIYEQILSKFIPKGGSKGQVLRKKSDADHDMEWGEGGGGGDFQLADFVVSVGGSKIADKTWLDVHDARQEGRRVYLDYIGLRYEYAGEGYDYYRFRCIDGTTFQYADLPDWTQTVSFHDEKVGLPQPETKDNGKVLTVSDGQPKWRDASSMTFVRVSGDNNFYHGENRYTPTQFANLVIGIYKHTNIGVVNYGRPYLLRSVSQKDGWTVEFFNIYVDDSDTVHPIRYDSLSVNTTSDEITIATEYLSWPEPIDNAPYICLLADLGEGLKVYNESGTETLNALAISSVMDSRPICLFEMQETGMVAYTLHMIGDGFLQFQQVDTTGNSITRTVVTITDTVTKEEVITDIPDIPAPTAEDNGKALVVENGSAVWSEIAGGGGEDEWRIIAHVILKEETSGVYITEDTEGNALSLREIMLHSKITPPTDVPAADRKLELAVRLKGSTHYNTTCYPGAVYSGGTKTAYAKGEVSISRGISNSVTSSTSPASYNTMGSMATWYGISPFTYSITYDYDTSVIDGILYYVMGNSHNMGVDSEIIIYGR